MGWGVTHIYLALGLLYCSSCIQLPNYNFEWRHIANFFDILSRYKLVKLDIIILVDERQSWKNASSLSCDLIYLFRFYQHLLQALASQVMDNKMMILHLKINKN